MSFDIPAELQLEIDRYAQDEQISPETATVRLIQQALSAKVVKDMPPQITDADLEVLKQRIPLLAHFARLDANTLTDRESYYEQLRSEQLIPRG